MLVKYRSGQWRQVGRPPLDAEITAGQTLAARWSNAGQAPVKRWSNAGQTLVKRWPHAHQTIVHSSTHPPPPSPPPFPHLRSLFKKIKGGAYTMPGYLSEGCRDLIPRMLLVDPLARITASQLR